MQAILATLAEDELEDVAEQAFQWNPRDWKQNTCGSTFVCV